MKYIAKIFILIFSLAVAGPVFAAKVSLKVNEFSTVKTGTTIHLGDLLADDKNLLMVDDDFFNLVVADPLNSEAEETLQAQSIAKALRQNLSFQELQKYSLVLPDAVKIRSKRNFISATVIKREVYARAKNFCLSCEVEFEEMNIPDTNLSEEILAYSINFDNFRNAGTFLLPLVLETSKGKMQKYLSGKVSLYKNVLVAGRLLQSGAKVNSQDLETKRINLNFAKDAVATLLETEGKITAHPIAMGQPIFVSDLKDELAVLRGQNVKAIISGDSFEVSINAVAEQSGSVGDLIKVKNSLTNKIMSGTLVEKGTVKLE